MAKVSIVPRKIVAFNPDESYNDDPFGPDGVTSAWNDLIPRMTTSTKQQGKVYLQHE